MTKILLSSNPCDAGLIAIKNINHGTTLLYSKNESIDGRKNLVVRLSEDNGTSWPFSRTMDKGEVWYSDMAALSKDKILLLYETGNDSPVFCTAFDLSWVKGE
ncbi:MAG: exo-alpha-sialidase [Saprospiraceae bacterium]|nr:exo-alpha-sialidase [Saprospiraceae bacterium]